MAVGFKSSSPVQLPFTPGIAGDSVTIMDIQPIKTEKRL